MFLSKMFNLRRARSLSDREGSSRRGRRYADSDREDYSVGRDSSTHSALFDLELSHRGIVAAEQPEPLGEEPDAAAAAAVPPTPQAALQRVAYLGRPTARFEVELLQDVEALLEACCAANGEVDLRRLAEDLERMGYVCAVQLSNGGGGTGAAERGAPLEKLRHGFIACFGRADAPAHVPRQHCLVDPRFRDQFTLGQPTGGYSVVLAAAPRVFVGSAMRLQALAAVLCGEIAASYQSQALPLPPWRKPAAMLSRWFDVSGAGQQQAQQAQQAQQQQQAQMQDAHAAAAVAAAAAAAGPPLEGADERSNKPRRQLAQAAPMAAALRRARSGDWAALAPIQEGPGSHSLRDGHSVSGGSASAASSAPSQNASAGDVGSIGAAGIAPGAGSNSGVSLLARALRRVRLNGGGSGGSGSASREGSSRRGKRAGGGPPPQQLPPLPQPTAPMYQGA